MQGLDVSLNWTEDSVEAKTPVSEQYRTPRLGSGFRGNINRTGHILSRMEERQLWAVEPNIISWWVNDIVNDYFQSEFKYSNSLLINKFQ